MRIDSEDQLRTIYGLPKGRAVAKVLDTLEKHSRRFIETSPFCLLATVSKSGQMDNSPRGGEPGFIHILDDHQLLIPDAKGNNRIDSLVNITETGTIALIFLIPGVDETLRINGHAYITTDQEYLTRFSDYSIPIKSCIVVEIKEVFLHCAKAFMRSRLWTEKVVEDRSDFPTMGRMLRDQIGGPDQIESQEEMIKRYQKDI